MPDKDRFEKSVTAAWRKVDRLARGAVASPTEVSDVCIAALAKSLRKADGCPGFYDIAKVIDAFAQELKSLQPRVTTGGPSLTITFESLRQIERQNGGHRVTKVAVRAAMSLVVKLDKERGLYNSQVVLTQRLAEETCLGLVDHHFFGRARAYLVGQVFSTFGEERAWEQAVKENMQHRVQKIAVSLSEDPSATQLRAPRRIVSQRSTRQLLNDPLTK